MQLVHKHSPSMKAKDLENSCTMSFVAQANLSKKNTNRDKLRWSEISTQNDDVITGVHNNRKKPLRVTRWEEDSAARRNGGK